MKNFKKRLLCLLLCVCMCSSLTFFANAVEPLDGPINADDNAQLIVEPTLEVSASPDGAVAIGRNLDTSSTYYYRVNGNILADNNADTMIAPGYFPLETQGGDNNSIASPNQVIEEDDRDEVTDTEVAPYSAICYIEIKFPGDPDPFPATAFMISEDTAMTAAHCLYQPSLGGWATSVTVYTGKDGLGFFNNPYDTADATEIVISANYYDSKVANPSVRNHYNDWGFIRVEDELDHDCGYLGFRYVHNNLEDLSLYVSGYPNPDRDDIQYHQFVGEGEIYTVSERSFQHTVDAEEGQSGAPVYYWDTSAGEYIVIGIHVSDGQAWNYNEASRITSQLFSFAWAYR